MPKDCTGLIRELIAAPWRIVYRISDVTVFVLLVIDSRQNVEDILLNRLIKQINVWSEP